MSEIGEMSFYVASIVLSKVHLVNMIAKMSEVHGKHEKARESESVGE